jgi:AcrR family transcriptional regulator
MPRGFTDHEKEVIRTRLLDEGFKLFSKYGLRKANVDELASAAGISKGAFYNFFESKEALYMDVVEQVETRMRQGIMATIDRPGSSPRARLVAIFKSAFDLFDTLPILQFLPADYELLFRRIPEGKIREHLSNDSKFFEVLVERCRQAGIPIQAPIDQISGLMYTLFLARMHGDDFGPGFFSNASGLLLELIAAFCLGDVTPEAVMQPGQMANSSEKAQNESDH